jgi:tRNA A37 threonylcarbamoyladenosine dehydratase
MSFLERSLLLIKDDGIQNLAKSHVLIVGVGGVGSYAAEAICRAGVGKITLIDGDVVQKSNINRQLPALHSTIDEAKVEIMRKRLLDINPNAEIQVLQQFIMPEAVEQVIPKDVDFVLDCIDSITPKITLIIHCKKNKIPFISSMGAGGKMDPSRIKIAEINDTKDCYFSRDIRKRLRKEKFSYGVKVVYSDEPVSKSTMALSPDTMYKKSFYGTISYMPAMFGMTMASFVIRKIINA